jgi:primosomal protein N' (replication factor Y)
MPLPEPFDYAVPEGVSVQPGDHVIVPWASARRAGWSGRLSPMTANAKLKSIEMVRGGPRIEKPVRDFIEWTARYLVEPQGVILRSVLRSPAALKPSPVETVYAPTGQPIARMTPARKAILDAVEDGPASAAELARRAGVSSSVVKGLAEAGALSAKEIAVDPPFPDPDPNRPGLPLTDLQEEASATLRRLVAAGGFQAALIDGVTGSGKTEVYFEAIAELLRREPDAQILVLLPEIALTQSVIKRFADRFGVEPARWHSGLADKERRRSWREAASGRARIVMGARSSIFLPMPKLRMIIVDEEHDPTYKQDEMLTYNARDLAVARSKAVRRSLDPGQRDAVPGKPRQRGSGPLRPCPLAGARHGLGSAGGGALRSAPGAAGEGRMAVPPLVDAVAETLERREQALLYLNRRGFAPLVLCKACGHKMKSPEADRWLVEHRYTGRLVCHTTGFSMPKPKLCPECKAEDSLIGVGPGVERVAEEAVRRFPDARIEVFSSDTAQSGEDVRALVERMEQGEIDILVGTQIAAKGHNFPHLTLVGVVDADLGLAGGDLRAGERTYQTLVQAAGRAGRADKPGRALLQTWNPDHEALRALEAGDRDAFLTAERQMRELLKLPPFGRLAALILSAPGRRSGRRRRPHDRHRRAVG